VNLDRSLDVTPKTTKQNLIVRIGTYEAEVGLTDNKRLRCRLEASRGLFVTAELLVL